MRIAMPASVAKNRARIPQPSLPDALIPRAPVESIGFSEQINLKVQFFCAPIPLRRNY